MAVRVAFLVIFVVIAFHLFVVVVVFVALVVITTTRTPVTERDFVGTRTRGILEPKRSAINLHSLEMRSINQSIKIYLHSES